MKEIGGKVNYFKYAECEKGQVLVDTMVYKGTQEGNYGRQNVFVSRTTGEKTVLNKAGQLDYKLDEFVEVGDTVTVIFDGTEILEKGKFAGKPVNNFVVNLHDDIPNKAPKEMTPAEKSEGTQESLLDKLNA